MRSPLRSCLAAVLLASAPNLVAQEATKVNFAELGKAFGERHGVDVENPGALLFSEFLDSTAFVRVRLGAFDVRYPAEALADKKRNRTFLDAVQTLVRLQIHWIEWFHSGRSGVEQGLADIETVGDWVDGWSVSALRKHAGGGDLVDLMGAKDGTREAIDRLWTFVGPSEEHLFELGDDVHRILLLPTRRDFLELFAFLGWIRPELRSFYWRDEAVSQTAAWYEWTHLVPMEASAWPVDFEHPFQAISLNERHKTGLAQFIADRASSVLLRTAFHRADYSAMESALRTNLVVASVGRDDLYLSDWGLNFAQSGSQTQGESKFVPATGLPANRSMPSTPNRGQGGSSAKEKPRWRKDEGKDYFVSALAKAQDDGASRAAKNRAARNWKDKRAHFELAPANQTIKAVVSAPFFGEAAARRDPVPKEFEGDYQEFARAYRSAFFQWMRLNGIPDSEEESAKAFAQLMHDHADPFGEVVFTDMVEKIYKVPLSAEDGDTDSLEWRFLTWLSKVRT